MSSASELRALLARSQFRRLYATRLMSQAADGVFQASLASAVLFNPERQTTAAAAAASFAVLLLPYSLVGPFAGVFLDRWRRQRVLVFANLVRAAMVVGVAAVMAWTGPTGPGFFLGALAVLSVNRFFLAGLSAALPHVVPERSLVTANSLTTTSGTLAASVGGAVALGLRGLVGGTDAGNAGVALLAAVAYGMSALLATRLNASLLGPDAAVQRVPLRAALAALSQGLLAGARHVRSRRPAAAALLAIGAHRFFYGIGVIAALLLYRNTFTDTDGLLRGGLVGLGQVVAASAVGVIVAAAVTPAVTARIGTQRWIVTVFATACVAEVVFGLPYRQGPLLVASLVLGFAAQASKICVDTIVQRSVDDEFRGRVFSLYDTLFNLTFLCAAVAGALTLPASGVSYPVLIAIAVGYGATALAYAVWGVPPLGDPPGAPPDTAAPSSPMPLAAAQERSSATARS